MKFSASIVQIDFTTIIFHLFLRGIKLTFRFLRSDRTNYHFCALIL